MKRTILVLGLLVLIILCLYPPCHLINEKGDIRERDSTRVLLWQVGEWRRFEVYGYGNGRDTYDVSAVARVDLGKFVVEFALCLAVMFFVTASLNKEVDGRKQ